MRLAFVLLLVVLGALPVHRARAQQPQKEGEIITSQGDTLRYRYNPLPETVVSGPAAVADTAAVRRRNIFRRIIDYYAAANVDHTYDKRIDFNFILGPSYSQEMSFTIGALASGLYRLDRRDSITPPSNLSIFGTVGVKGFWAIGVFGNNLFRGQRNRINYETSFRSMPAYYWGRGYDMAMDDSNGRPYTEKRFAFTGNYLHRVFENAYIGVAVDALYSNGKQKKTFTYDDPETGEPVTSGFLQTLAAEGEAAKNAAVGIGAVIEYDSRDFIPNPHKGIYIGIKELIRPGFLNNHHVTMLQTTVNFNAYKRIWRDCVLAYDLTGDFNSENTPWCMIARMGGSKRMRGYYQGRFTDYCMITTQLELRQRIWQRIGCVVWAGAGNVFPNFREYRWEHTLPNYGVGLRWEFKRRVNIRIDYGFGKGKNNNILFNIDEAF